MKNLTAERLINLVRQNWGWPFVLRFILHFVLIYSVMSGVTYLLYARELKAAWEEIKRKDTSQVALQHDLLINEIQLAFSDILFVKELPALKHYLNSPEVLTKSDLEKVLKALGDNRLIYYSIRYIDERGNEVIRVDFNKVMSKVASSNTLKNVSDQPFFQETTKLQKNEVYISSLELETANGELLNPYQPTLRFASPVLDDLGIFRGMMVLNFKGTILLDTLTRYKVLHSDGGAAFLLNPESYYLYNQNQPNSAWGFQRPAWQDFRFDTNYPEEWALVNKSEDGQFFTKNGLFTFSTFWPTEATYFSFSKSGISSPQDQTNYKLVFFYPYTKYDQSVSRIITINYTLYMAILGAMAILFSFALTWGSLELARQQLELTHSALHDALTGLPNRNLFKDRLLQAMMIAKRTQSMVAMYFIDLDGFKEINDTYGHDAGDAMLKHVSANLLLIMREADTLARLGGDEFCSICIGFNKPEDVEILGKRMLTAIALPLNYEGNLMNVTGSIGIALQSNVTISGDDLIRSADDAMYHAKENGKNQYFIDDPLHRAQSPHPA